MEAKVAQAVPGTAPGRIDLANLWWVAAALVIMIVAIVFGDLWHLNFVHVLTGLLWTGIDLFTGFVLGPIMRSVDLPTRRALVLRLMPRMVFIMPTLSIITPTTGWYLAERLGLLGLPWPAMGWTVAALTITTLLAVQGLGVLLPTNLKVCFELQKQRPDFDRIGRLMRRYVWTVASQGTLQVVIIVIMARFATGL
jgi:uncharacterized membrane protein